MGDLDLDPPLTPPGFRFHPTDQQLLCFYLTNKNNRNPNPNISFIPIPNPPFLSFDVIQEIDLYNSDPCDLPEIASFPFGHGGRRKHWYCFTLRVAKGGLRRKAKGGFWKRKGPARTVLAGKDGVVVGTKAKFVFYRRESAPRGSFKTNWVLIEYALVDHQKDSFVLCRIFLKPCNGTKIVEVVRNSYAEQNIEPKQNCSIDLPSLKHDTTSTSDMAKVIGTAKSTSEPDDQAVKRPVSEDDVGSFLDIENFFKPVNSSSWFTGGDMNLEDFMSAELRVNSTILEGDFLELNDLLGPLACPYSSG